MVELAAAPYDYDGIPLVAASIVSIDAELSHDSLVIAQAAPSPFSSIASNSASSFESEPIASELSIPEHQPSFPNADTAESHHNEESYQSVGDDNGESQRTIGAGAAGAVLGLLMGGPILSLLFGFGTAYYTKKDGATGDVARALGDVALVARDKWREVDSKHNIADRSRQAANAAIHRAHESERRRRSKKECFRFVAYCWKTTFEFMERHRLAERGSRQLKVLVDHCAKKIQDRVRTCPHQNRGEHASERSQERR